MKNLKPSLSRTYVNHKGKIVRCPSFVERIYLHVHNIFKTLPFVAVFIIVSLLFVEIGCIVGLWQALSGTALPLVEVMAYSFVFLASATIQLLGLGVGWWLAEHKDANVKKDNKNYQKATKKTNSEL
ncbi:MAG: hypothetical protein RMJ44_02655 [Cytophagales bacterium]|nr:hypothetical protein [Bernardetiaceae bacterium]MDW8209963.1 hypothetical protein [Cytophagales bacterium]